jgi:hypothetical protein
MKLLATASDDEPIDGGLKENSDVINAPQSHENDRSRSPYMTPAPAGTPLERSASILGL